MAKSRITASVMSGLGNRLRVLCGARVVGRRLALPVDVYWPRNKGFEPSLSELWEMDVREIGWVSERLAYLAAGARYDENMSSYSEDRGPIHIRTKHALKLPDGHEDWGVELRSARPVPQVRDRVSRVWDDHGLAGWRYIGVMIRANSMSHPKTLAASPVAWYVEQASKISAQVGIDRFYLSTDSPGAAAEFREHFPNTTLIEDKGPYNSIAGVRDAIADLYLLASSSIILGPYWSSFVSVAEKLAPLVPSYDASNMVETVSSRLTVPTDPLMPWIAHEGPRG